MNNSKQTVLSIVGIAILVIAVVGVSFAFFTYSRNGTTNNVITTGTIQFEYAETAASALNITNAFPQTAAEALAEYTRQENPRTPFTFNVHGTLPATTNAVNYDVYIVPGGASGDANKTVRFQDSEINVQLTHGTSTPYTTGKSTIIGGYDGANGAALTNAVSSYNGTTNKGLKVAEGTIDADGQLHTNNYILKMWVNDSVHISDTDSTNAQYRAKAYDATDWPEGDSEDTRDVYSTLYYSIKVNVEATDNARS